MEQYSNILSTFILITFRLITELDWEYAILVTGGLVLSCCAFGCLMRPLESSQAKANHYHHLQHQQQKQQCHHYQHHLKIIINMIVIILLAEGGTSRRGGKAADPEQWNPTGGRIGRQWETSERTCRSLSSSE